MLKIIMNERSKYMQPLLITPIEKCEISHMHNLPMQCAHKIFLIRVCKGRSKKKSLGNVIDCLAKTVKRSYKNILSDCQVFLGIWVEATNKCSRTTHCWLSSNSYRLLRLSADRILLLLGVGCESTWYVGH
jgi:hypothetical protein